MSRITLGALALWIGLAAAPLHAAEAATQVTVEGGRLQGHATDGLLVFKGIPYAAPPVGPLRWRAPQPVPRWSGVREARAYGPDCMQRPFATDDAPLTTDPSEDCLYANVWRPAQAAGPLPVLVWVHGGGFVNGGGSPPSYAGAALARQGVLVVSFNYRLGRFGTFDHPALAKADADHGRGVNFGILDQVAALEWVKRNIAAFGGDPRNVTVMGESAGGMSVHALLTSPLAQGLFQKAVIQSGGEPAARATRADAEQAGLRFARTLGVADDDAQALAKLRALPAEAILGDLNLTTLDRNLGPTGTYVFPVADGKVVADLAAAYRDGKFNRVPLMVGATADDIGGPDGYMVNGAKQTAELFAKDGLPTWYYRFGYVAEATRAVHPKGAAHASEIPYFFGTVGVRYGGDTRPGDMALSAKASGYLVNFVRSGNPNGEGVPAWKPYVAGQGPMQVFGLTGEVGP
ncbi:carboxylesterase [Stenotrophomonas panacihumi]|uniref:Carboxylic ester hydrolase n=1 Tax=Stenotrophomonas panacihumi TaxID=676599 RepID=A0A0R0AH19_9GAMM|nr:carboxylesterase family protein [Stenotrophomonas panacihumi]KRG44223.1 carboxylesterase [Stenotrophomonas panacihumi]PTN56213.1 carboxylesterase [Stenotrophomonas panacihumi]